MQGEWKLSSPLQLWDSSPRDDLQSIQILRQILILFGFRNANETTATVTKLFRCISDSIAFCKANPHCMWVSSYRQENSHLYVSETVDDCCSCFCYSDLYICCKFSSTITDNFRENDIRNVFGFKGCFRTGFPYLKILSDCPKKVKTLLSISIIALEQSYSGWVVKNLSWRDIWGLIELKQNEHWAVYVGGTSGPITCSINSWVPLSYDQPPE